MSQSVSALPACQDGLQGTIEQHFPNLWPAVEVGLATCATLLLKDNVNPVALIYVAPASAGKTTVASMFEGAKVGEDLLCYRTDKFTPASFVSQSAKATGKQLENVDLLPRIKHKVLVTPELSTIFRGRPDELVERFSTITRVLDGQGLSTDSGTHGRRGYTGDYLFAWLGCTTPLQDAVWKVMAQLGSRLFFLAMDAVAEPTVDDLVRSIQQPVPYGDKVKSCQGAVHQFLGELFARHGGVRGVQWMREDDPEGVLPNIARYASLLALMRTPFENLETTAEPESPHRAMAVLYNLIRGRALVHGRTVLTNDDLPMIGEIVMSSMPTRRRAVLVAMAQNGGQPLTVKEVQAAIGVKSPHTAEQLMAEMDWLGCMRYEKPGNGKASTLHLHPDWEWCMSPEFTPLLLQS